MPKRLFLLAGSLALGACSAVGIRSGTEEPAYEVVARLDHEVEVRCYGPRLAAETTVAGEESGKVRGAAFGRLARFIFGDNRSQAEIAMTAPVQVESGRQRIAMTAPVETAAGESSLTMRFFMPASFTRATLPDPKDSAIRIVEVPAETLAVLRFTGSIAAGAVSARESELLDVLTGSAWRPTGPPRALFYDPPWTIPFLRRNEVAVAVEPRPGG